MAIRRDDGGSVILERADKKGHVYYYNKINSVLSLKVKFYYTPTVIEGKDATILGLVI